MGDMDDIVKDFLVESNENLDQLDRDLVTLEKDPTAREVLASIFRTIHTIKGTTGFLGFSRLESVAHVGENLLSSLRDGRLLLNAEITSALLAMVDAVRQMLVHIENTGQEGEGDYSSLIENLTRLQMGEKKKKKSSPARVAPEAPDRVRGSSPCGSGAASFRSSPGAYGRKNITFCSRAASTAARPGRNRTKAGRFPSGRIAFRRDIGAIGGHDARADPGGFGPPARRGCPPHRGDPRGEGRRQACCNPGGITGPGGSTLLGTFRKQHPGGCGFAG